MQSFLSDMPEAGAESLESVQLPHQLKKKEVDEKEKWRRGLSEMLG